MFWGVKTGSRAVTHVYSDFLWRPGLSLAWDKHTGHSTLGSPFLVFCFFKLEGYPVGLTHLINDQL